ncbi:ATP-binding protein [Paraglaciecola chathamensis]|uniref:ATP-binding protein n=1 Tax=Paraglaciecola chathamensis TaxID=368405 RepID=UPI00270440C6|nr:ATP-binding protein [Paraglaciecola chathamensis]MDO6839888.1 ATP-binding protein [Paraglaciecola chathamensis]
MSKFHLSQTGFIIGCALIFTLGLATLWFNYVDVSQRVNRETHTALALQSSAKGAIIEQTLLGSIRHTRFIYATPPVSGVVRAYQNGGQDPVGQTSYAHWVQRLESIFSTYIQNNPDIVQIRFIGKANDGRELVRVHRHGDKIEAVDEKNLQGKSQRGYFKSVQNLPAGHLYISEISLNREYGEIEQPPWPTYRIAQPVYDEQARFFGLVIINFNAQLLLDKLTQHTPAHSALFLLNQHGQYLLHPEQHKAFSFEYAETQTWYEDAQSLPSTQQAETEINLVKFETTGVIYNVSEYSVHMPVSSHVPPLTIVAAMQHEQVQNTILQRYGTSVLFNLGLIFLTLILLTLYRLYSHASFLRVKLQAEIEAIFQGSNDIIISIKADGKIDSWNHTALAFFSMSEASMKNANINELVAEPQALNAIKQHVKAVFSGLEVSPLEVNLSRKKKAPKVMSAAFSPVKIGKKSVSSVSAILRDVTDASLLRISLQQSKDKLESRNEEMQAFLYTVSHDLKSPLVTIGGFTDRILESAGDNLSDKNHHRLSRIKSNVNHMSLLLSELLDLARIARQKVQFDISSFQTCIEKAQQSLNQSIIDSNAIFDIENSQQTLKVNAQLLTQCLQNLFSNAINYASENSPPVIKIRCFQRGNLQCISVSDNGIGIDAKHHEIIFKIFERLNVGNGTGVGLAIVRTIMEKHHGWVELVSMPQKGSTFTLCFPQPKD